MTNWFVAFGASGSEGLGDITNLLSSFPADCPAIFMVVLHRPSDAQSELAQVLRHHCAMPVAIARQAQTLERSVCYIGEPADHLTLMHHRRAHMVEGLHNAYRNRTVDLLFMSIARFARHRAIGVVLSGALDDGSRGLAQIHAAGGVTMVLRPGTKPRGMQQNAIEYDGPVSLIGTSEQLAREIYRLVSSPASELLPATLRRTQC
ncbi:chemotaxis protein CheB [Paraburkholderia strydomiana]